MESVDVADPFVNLITQLIKSHSNPSEENFTGHPTGSLFITEQWMAAIALAHKRHLLQHAQTASAMDAANPSAKKARLMRLIGKSRVDSNSEKNHKTPWFFKAREEMRENDWKIMREDFGIRVTSLKAAHSHAAHVPPPLRCWADAALPPGLLELLTGPLGISHPSPVQMQAVPIILAGKDLVARAETGSGKSIAFLLPMLLKLPAATETAFPRALCLAPTQELARQLHAVATPLADHLGLRCVLAVGGESIQANASRIRPGVGCVVGTPGRVCDLVDGHWLALAELAMIAVDEADRCTDAGLIESVRRIVTAGKVQLVFFSATFGDSMGFIREAVRPDALFVHVTGSSQRIRHLVERAGDNPHETVTRLVHRYLRAYAPPVIIFCNSRESCEALVARLDALDVAGAVLHAGLSSTERQRIFSAFREQKTPILVTTDALARGIDIEDISLVVNFDAPTGADALARYIHRVGRTGRAGKSGVACTFVRKGDEAFAQALRRYLAECDQPIPRDVEKMCGKSGDAGETLLIL